MIIQSTRLLITEVWKKVLVALHVNSRTDFIDFPSYLPDSLSVPKVQLFAAANLPERHSSLWRRTIVVFGLALGFFYVSVNSSIWFNANYLYTFWAIGSMLLSLFLANRYDRLLKEKLQLEADLKAREKDLSMLVANNKIRYNERKKFLGDLHELAQLNSKDLQKNLKSQALNLIKGLNREEKFLHRSDHMELLNASFEEKLKTTFPNLSKTELEICGYIKTNLTLKEIAELRGSSEGAIKMTRHRLKTKMQLEDQDLDNFIRSTF